MFIPQIRAVSAPEGGEGPAFSTWPPACQGRRTVTQAPGTIGSQEKNGIGPGTPLGRDDTGAFVPTLFFAQTQTGFHFAVSDFDLPPLPQPGQDGCDREWQLPLSCRRLESRNQVEGWATVLIAKFFLAHQAVHTFHDDQEEWAFRQTFTYKRAQDLVAHLDQLATYFNLLVRPVA